MSQNGHSFHRGRNYSPNSKIQRCWAWFLGQVMIQDSVVQLQPDALTSAGTDQGDG